MLVLVTGASGFVGSHVAERLIREGHRVRTLARSQRNRELLDQWRVEVIEGDLEDPRALAQAVQGVDAIVHCAAKVGDWGSIEDYRKVNVDAFRLLLDQCIRVPPPRIVLISSLGVYEARDHYQTDESAPLPDRHIDAYTQTKVEAEQVARDYVQARNLPIVILRPGLIYGPRDETALPRILANLRRRIVTYFGSRHKTLNHTYIDNLVDAVLLALAYPTPKGDAFNITDDPCVSKKTFFETLCKMTGLPRPLATYPMPVARVLCRSFEALGKTLGFQPLLNMARLKFMGLNLDYSIEKAKRELGYRPKVPFEQGMADTVEWLRQSGRLG